MRRQRRLLRTFIALFAKDLLNAPDRVALLVEQAIDSTRKLNVGWTVVTTIPCALHGTQLREARFPIAQDVLGDPKLLRQFANRQKSAGIFLSGSLQALSPERSGRA